MRTDMARNLIVKAFLEHSENDGDTLIMLDADHIHPPDILDRLARFPDELGVVGALAYRRGGNHDPMFFFRQPDGELHSAMTWDNEGVYQCDAVATCAIAIKRWVFQKLDESGWAWPYFRYEYPESGAVPSEDIVFARACEATGIPHHCDTSTLTPHLISDVADGRQWQASLAEQRHGPSTGSGNAEFAEAPPREEFPRLLDEIGAEIGAEIGVQRGEFSEYILANWDGILYMVDPWEYRVEEYNDPANVSDAEHETNYREAMRRMEPFWPRVRIMRKVSVEAAPCFENDELDFVYIDANHSYEAVTADLEAWYPKVRPGGIIAGDDFINNSHPRFECRVKDAVIDFAGARGHAVHVSREPWPRLWYFVK
jgi:hypothetical protein